MLRMARCNPMMAHGAVVPHICRHVSRGETLGEEIIGARAETFRCQVEKTLSRACE